MLFGSFQHMHLSVLSMGHGWQLILLSKCLLFWGLSMHALLGGKPEFIYHFMRPLSWAPPLYNFPEISGSLASLKVLWSENQVFSMSSLFYTCHDFTCIRGQGMGSQRGEKKPTMIIYCRPLWHSLCGQTEGSPPWEFTCLEATATVTTPLPAIAE